MGYHGFNMTRSEFRRHVVATYDISETAFCRILEESLAYFGMTLEEYVRSRHLELQRTGRKNAEIYRIILDETKDMRFAAKGLTERRVRRLIYG
jgi:hypothetical protein